MRKTDEYIAMMRELFRGYPCLTVVHPIGTTPMTNEEQALISACRSGDVIAFESIVDGYHDRLIRVLYLLTGDRDDALDVAQETFIRAYKYMHTFRGQSSIATWLHRIAINTAHNWMRDNRRKTELPTAAEDMRCEDASTPEALLLERERSTVIRQALASLPVHYREAIVLRHYDELSYEEIAEVQQVPIGTVRSRLAKGRTLLHDRLTIADRLPDTEEGP